MHQHEPNDWRKYIIVLFITLIIFLSILWLSNYFSNKKIDQLRSIQNTISLDLMSSEVQFSLLEEMSCKYISTTVLSSELNSLADKISYSEENIGIQNVDVISLKKNYSLLQIKDYLLMKKITERCGQKPIFILYFYKNDNCPDCTKQGYVLTSLRENYPNLRVYSFDYNLDVSAIKTLISIYEIPDDLPAMVINDEVYSGFKNVEEIEKILPQLETIKVEDESMDSKLKNTFNFIKESII
jgi:hypothetical protein